jgi:hypothetical protein
MTNSWSNIITYCAVDEAGTYQTCRTSYVSGLLEGTGVTIVGSNLYILDRHFNTVIRCSIADTGDVGHIVGAGSCTTNTPSSGFNVNQPRGIEIVNNVAYITNASGNSVTECAVDASTGDFTSCAVASVAGGFTMVSPTGIAILGSTAFVTNYDYNYVTECAISASGSLTSCKKSTVAGGFEYMNGPQGITISNSKAYIVSYWTNRLSVCEIADGTITACSATVDNAFHGSVGVAATGSTVYATNYNSETVTQCTLSATGYPSDCTVKTPVGGFRFPNRPIGITIT